MTKALLLFLAFQGSGIELPVKEHTLDNGMKILMVPRKETPRVFCALYWKVGSANERPGITGLSHFFEHMMFKGTETIGTRDPKKDAELNAKIELVMGKVRKLKLERLECDRRGIAFPKESGEKIRALLAEYKALVEAQKKITISEHLTKMFMANGGTGLNASTYYDWTRYFVELPANKVELFFWLESDRFLKPVFREFYPEREVVKEERRMRYDATPTGLIQQAYSAMFWQSHPYTWPIIGWMSDIDMYTHEDALKYFAVHYSPSNCVAVFVGDLDPIKIIQLSKKYFGRIPRSKKDPAPIVTTEVEQVAERRMTAEAESRPHIIIRWHAPSTIHSETAPLDLATMVLDGRSGRLYRELVVKKKLALGTGASYYAFKYGGYVQIYAIPRPGVTFVALEKAIDEVLDHLKKEGATPRELQKVKNQSIAAVARGLQTNKGIGNQIGMAAVNGEWKDAVGYLDNIAAVTPAALKAAAIKYYTAKGKNVLIVKRKGGK